MRLNLKRWVIGGSTLVAVLLLIVVASPSIGGSPAPRQGSWPVRLHYAVDDYGEQAAHSEYVLEAVDWTSWRQETLCCDRDAGFVTQLTPDGSFWSGGVDGLPFALGFVHEGGDGMVPLPEFAPRFSPDASELGSTPFVRVTFDQESNIALDEARATVTQLAEGLGLRIEDLVAYEVGRDVVTDGGTSYEIDYRIVYKPINLTLQVVEIIDGVTVRAFTVTKIDFLLEGFTPEFG